MKIKLTISYKGTAYCGFQVQPNQPTIEGEINRALTDLYGLPITVTGASRTDAGVHALGNVATFDVDSPIPPERIAYALNARLPKDIVITGSELVPMDFHPRKNVLNKTYEYKILNTHFPNPLLSDTTHHFYYDLDVDKMNKACQYLVGEHDFTSFCSIKTQTQTNVRTIYAANVTRDKDIVTISVTGNGFLYNMVRIIAGTLIEVGNNRRSYDLSKALEALDRNQSGPTAPANGLCLMNIVYKQ